MSNCPEIGAKENTVWLLGEGHYWPSGELEAPSQRTRTVPAHLVIVFQVQEKTGAGRDWQLSPKPFRRPRGPGDLTEVLFFCQEVETRLQRMQCLAPRKQTWLLSLSVFPVLGIEPRVCACHGPHSCSSLKQSCDTPVPALGLVLNEHQRNERQGRSSNRLNPPWLSSFLLK